MERYRPPSYIWNKGIAALCDHRFPDDFRDGAYRFHGESDVLADPVSYRSLASTIQEGDLVWVRTDWLAVFVRDILSDIEQEFTLVTGDADHSLPSWLPDEAATLVGSTKVGQWFTQNFDGSDGSGKVRGIPIGIDFHTLQQYANWGRPKTEIAQQARELEEIGRNLPSAADRMLSVYVDAQFRSYRAVARAGSMNDLDRSMVFDRLAGNPSVHVRDDFLAQDQMWRERGNHLFVLSHHGNGLDCHRTWEALVLGHVVIMQHSSLDPLFTDLPVVLLDDLREISPTNLEQWRAELDGRDHDFSKLTSEFWVTMMRERTW